MHTVQQMIRKGQVPQHKTYSTQHSIRHSTWHNTRHVAAGGGTPRPALVSTLPWQVELGARVRKAFEFMEMSGQVRSEPQPVQSPRPVLYCPIHLSYPTHPIPSALLPYTFSSPIRPPTLYVFQSHPINPLSPRSPAPHTLPSQRITPLNRFGSMPSSVRSCPVPARVIPPHPVPSHRYAPPSLLTLPHPIPFNMGSHR